MRKLRFWVLAPILLVSTIGNVCAELVRERETNNTIISAQPVSTLTSIGGVISSASDTDIYAFRAELGQIINADMLARGFRAGSQPGSDLSARLTLLDSDGTTVLAEDVSVGDYDDPFIEYQFLSSGTFYFRVTDQNGTGGADHTYVLSLEIEQPFITDPAVWITPPVMPSIDALINPMEDIDEYKFQGSAGQIVTIDIDTAVFNPTVPIQIIVTLMDNNRIVLAQDGYDPVTDLFDPFIQYTLTATGTYRIAIRERRTYIGHSAAFYQMSVDLNPAVSNNSFGSASPINLPRAVSGTISPTGDVDHYGFTSSIAGTVSADLDAAQDLLSLLTGTLSINNSSGVIAQNSATPDPLLSTAIGTGPHSVAVSGTSSGLYEDAYYQLYLDTDADGDSLYLPNDNCPTVSNPLQEDQDRDGVGDACDSCVAVFGPNQEDRDNDGLGDSCDLDDDNDGLEDDFERSILTDPYIDDTDGDGLTDYQEVAYDGDATTYNPNITDLNAHLVDSDFDGLIDSVDPIPITFNLNDSDLAPRGAANGIIDVADLAIAIRIALGDPATNYDLSHGDVYPVGAPDGVINLSDVILIMKQVLQ